MNHFINNRDFINNLSVNTESTYGNSVYPGNYIDIYLKAVNRIPDEQASTDPDANKVMFENAYSNPVAFALGFDIDGDDDFFSEE